ncbi:MAG: hypothetical protein LBC72_04665 [Spirochaetaceae bacterium]|jgi:hypothetical protein|nr:hypothetical protein [Spirochaetaceae bacterium]
MKKYILLYAAVCVLCSCNFFAKESDEQRGEGNIAAYLIEYTVEVINKTDTDVTLYDPGFLTLDLPDNTVSSSMLKPDIPLCEIPGEGKKTCRFYKPLKYTLYLSDNPSHPVPDAEKLVSEFEPYIASFFILVTVGGSDHYISGWPSEYNSKTSMPPPEGVVQNNICWSENRDVRIKNNRAYVPFIVKYGIMTKDFDDATTVKAHATLTINSADDIRFETTSLSRSS